MRKMRWSPDRCLNSKCTYEKKCLAISEQKETSLIYLRISINLTSTTKVKGDLSKALCVKLWRKRIFSGLSLSTLALEILDNIVMHDIKREDYELERKTQNCLSDDMIVHRISKQIYRKWSVLIRASISQWTQNKFTKALPQFIHQQQMVRVWNEI